MTAQAQRPSPAPTPLDKLRNEGLRIQNEATRLAIRRDELKADLAKQQAEHRHFSHLEATAADTKEKSKASVERKKREVAIAGIEDEVGVIANALSVNAEMAEGHAAEQKKATYQAIENRKTELIKLNVQHASALEDSLKKASRLFELHRNTVAEFAMVAGGTGANREFLTAPHIETRFMLLLQHYFSHVSGGMLPQSPTAMSGQDHRPFASTEMAVLSQFLDRAEEIGK